MVVDQLNDLRNDFMFNATSRHALTIGAFRVNKTTCYIIEWCQFYASIMFEQKAVVFCMGTGATNQDY